MIENHEIDRNEYLAQCKKRALKFLDEGDVVNAVASMGSDLMKHKDFRGVAEKLMPYGMYIALRGDVIEARSFIVGFR